MNLGLLAEQAILEEKANQRRSHSQRDQMFGRRSRVAAPRIWLCKFEFVRRQSIYMKAPW